MQNQCVCSKKVLLSNSEKLSLFKKNQGKMFLIKKSEINQKTLMKKIFKRCVQNFEKKSSNEYIL